MMWYPRKIHSHPDLDLSSRWFWDTCQISGRNFFQVGDDVTTRKFKSLLCVLIHCYTLYLV
ncbi:hypothetical protein Hanom_Chr13g01224751 [Helianthus anomalus]